MPLGQTYPANELPFIDHGQTAGRFVASFCFWAEGEWRTLAPLGDGRYMEIAAWPAELAYLGKDRQQATDYYSHFLNFLGQHGNGVALMPMFSSIEEDIFSLAASFAKLKLIHASTERGAGRMAATEVEYILTVCRTMFDLLQEVLAKTWKTLKRDDGARTKALKETFSRIVLGDKDRIKTVDEIVAQFDIPEPLAHCYTRHVPLFVKIRQFRNSVVHGFSKAETIWRGERDFLIEKQLGPFKNLEIWRDDEIEPHDLAPLTPALALMVYGTLQACDEFAVVLQALVRFPPATVPNMRIFLRGHFSEVFADIMTDADKRTGASRQLVELPPHPWAVAAAGQAEGPTEVSDD